MHSLSGEVERGVVEAKLLSPEPHELLERLNRDLSNGAFKSLLEWLNARQERLKEQVLSDLDPRTAGKVDGFRYIITELTEARARADR